MNWNYFGLFGYISLLLAIAVPFLWLLHRMQRPRRWHCHLALLVAVAALGFAKLNSITHVNRIRVDQTEMMAARAAEEEAAARRNSIAEQRGTEVAQIRFAEDGAGDFIDRAGLDEEALKYLDEAEAGGGEDEVPAWKREKQTRSGEGAVDDGLETAIDGEKEDDPDLATDELGQEVGPEPILMSEAEMVMANRLDGLNLKLIRWLILAAILVVILDYLRRLNNYREAYCPLPLPSALPNSLNPIPALVERPEPRRSLAEELAWLVRRGDSFLLLTDDPAAADSVPETLPRLAKGRCPADIIRVTGDDAELTDDFIFEALWFGRSSFVVDSSARADRILARFNALLERRMGTRARTAQTAHVVWAMSSPPSESVKTEFVRRAEATGLSLFLCPESDRVAAATAPVTPELSDPVGQPQPLGSQ